MLVAIRVGDILFISITVKCRVDIRYEMDSKCMIIIMMYLDVRYYKGY